MHGVEENLLWNLKKLNMGMESLMNSQFEDMGLTASQGAVLLYILNYPENTICSSGIHRAFGVARPTISCLLKKLRQKGYIEFRRCELDVRQKMISATPEAIALRETLYLRMQDMGRHVLEGFTEEDIQAVGTCFDRMDSNMKSYQAGYGKYKEKER